VPDEHDHHHHAHDGADHTHDEDERPGVEGEGEAPDISGWINATPKESCPACGAVGAVRLGGGLFCPACGQMTTVGGYVAPPADAPAE
jgi:hypothetical protein